MVCSRASLQTDSGVYSIDEKLNVIECFRDMDRVKVQVTSSKASKQVKTNPEKNEAKAELPKAAPSKQQNKPQVPEGKTEQTSKVGQQTPKSISTPKSQAKNPLVQKQVETPSSKQAKHKIKAEGKSNDQTTNN